MRLTDILDVNRNVRLIGLVLALIALTAFACVAPPTGPGTIVISNTNTNTQGGGQGTPGASPSPGAPTSFDNVGIGVYARSRECRPGPPTEFTMLGIGCGYAVTATPKLGAVEVPESVHGPLCNWAFNGTLIDKGAAENAVARCVIQSSTGTSRGFNIDCVAKAAGNFTLEAEVKGVRSGARTFFVEP